MNAEEIYAAGGERALRLATRGAVRQLTQQGRVADILVEVAIPVVRLANRLRAGGDKLTANNILEHAVHDGVQAAVLAEAIQVATGDDFRGDAAPVPLSVGTLGLIAGPPPAATDLASALALINYLRDRLLSFED